MKRRGGKRVGVWQEKLPALTKRTREMNQLTFQSKSWLYMYIFGKSVEEGYIYLENQPFLTFDNDSDFVSFLTCNDSSNLEVFVNVWLSLDKFIGEC